jgi:hypothetical protein
MEDSMKVSGSQMSDKDEALKDTQMETPTMVHSELGKRTVKEFINGVMGRSMMENGTMDLSMAMAFGRDSLGIHTLENGGILKQKDMGFIIGRLGIGTKENGSSVLNMDKGLTSSATVMHTQENTKMGNQMGRDNILGRMDLSM